MAKVSITKHVEFEAAHYLPDYDGKCATMHGHSYKLDVTISCDSLIKEGPEKGMVIDFVDLKRMIQVITGSFDHRVINDVAPYRPTAENMTIDIYDRLNRMLDCQQDFLMRDVKCSRVRLWETSTSFAEVEE